MDEREALIALGHTLSATLAALDRLPPAHCEDLAKQVADLRASYPDLFRFAAPRHVCSLLDGYGGLDRRGRDRCLRDALVVLRGHLYPDHTESHNVFSLATCLKAVPGLAEAQVQALARLDLHTVEDVLYYLPVRYVDMREILPIAMLFSGQQATIAGTLVRQFTYTTRREVAATDAVLQDDIGNTMTVAFYGAGAFLSRVGPNTRVVVHGRVEGNGRRLKLNAEEWELDDGNQKLIGLRPVYSLTKGLNVFQLRRIVRHLLERALPLVDDYLDEAACARLDVLPLDAAIRQIHFPDAPDMCDRARERIAFDEFLAIQLGVRQRRRLWQSAPGRAMPVYDEAAAALVRSLPFTLTGAQRQVIDEIAGDLARPLPMARLLQGDVGSGKTVVAVATATQAIANGYQVAVMAPTEILAEQHGRSFRALLHHVALPRRPLEPATAGYSPGMTAIFERLVTLEQRLGIDAEAERRRPRIVQLTGKLPQRQRREALEAIASGEADVIVGTHALISEDVEYLQLGLVIVDEQHRFGVEQRARLQRKGFNPHLLVMSATPIPRTLTMAIYGDLDTSVLGEMPPGRMPIKTTRIGTSDRQQAYAHIQRELAAGRQAFVICPVIEENEQVPWPSAEQMYVDLHQRVFPGVRIGLLHGKVPPADKEATMRAFHAGEYQILVATTVVEVGIDVPNATTIMIEGADRFGLAQLHQLRGRVGRGDHQSYCILVTDAGGEGTRHRMEMMTKTTDGFALAAADLEHRGPGAFFGVRQSGTPDLKAARLADTRILNRAAEEAECILTIDPLLERRDHELLRQKVERVWESVIRAG